MNAELCHYRTLIREIHVSDPVGLIFPRTATHIIRAAGLARGHVSLVKCSKSRRRETTRLTQEGMEFQELVSESEWQVFAIQIRRDAFDQRFPYRKQDRYLLRYDGQDSH